MRSKLQWLGILACVLALPTAGAAQGIYFPGAGAMHRSMGGASTAYAVDAAGALYWNPATISGLSGSEVVIASEMLMPYTHLSSTVPAGAFGPLGPATTQSGTTLSDASLTPISNIAIVYKADEIFTYGMSLSTVAGGGTNFPGDPSNPILAPKGPLKQFILGPEASSLTLLQLAPSVSAQVTERLAVGVSPMVDIVVTSFDPAFFGPTSQANPLAPKIFPTGSHSSPFWGGGFRAGTTYKAADHIYAGFSYTSKQWFQTWRFNARNADGDPANFTTKFSTPQIFSMGLAYDGIDRLLLVSDVRYFDFHNTDLLGTSVRDGGAGWQNVWSFAFGARYRLTERLSAQIGYVYNDNPIPADLALFNTQLPALNQHTFSVGSYFQLNDSIGASLAYMHGFKNSITGTVLQAIGGSTTIDAAYDSFALNLHVRFGARCQ